MIKAVILVGGPEKGTRFRPLSLDVPKPLFPVAGRPIIQHHIEACVQLKQLKEILLIGYYPSAQMESFVRDMQNLYDGIGIRYLQEFTMLGTGGGMYHFRDQIRAGNPSAFFILNGDVCADFPLQELLDFHLSKTNAEITIMSTEATRQQSIHYGCLVIDNKSGLVNHYVEKPETYVSTFINCGVYVSSTDVFPRISAIFHSREQQQTFRSTGGSPNGNNGKDQAHIQWEREILTPLAGTGKLFALPVKNWWSQIKTAGSAIHANRHYLGLYKCTHPERLANPGLKSNNEQDGSLICNILPDVYIHPTAVIHPSATLGPNVSVGAGVNIGAGIRIRECIILDNAIIQDHSLILYSIIGRSSKIGCWTRVEGTPSDPDPNKPFAKMDNPPLFNSEGKLNPSITILGYCVTVPSEKILLNSIVLPHKELSRNFKNEIIL